jgi:DNA-binding GntR family transcriptional regulator
LLHLAGYWWKPDVNPFPSKETLANAIGVSSRTIQRRIADLEKANLVKRISRKGSHKGNLTNAYDLSGLIREAEPFAVEKMEEKNRRKKEDTKERFERKKPLKPQSKARG